MLIVLVLMLVSLVFWTYIFSKRLISSPRRFYSSGEFEAENRQGMLYTSETIKPAKRELLLYTPHRKAREGQERWDLLTILHKERIKIKENTAFRQSVW